MGKSIYPTIKENFMELELCFRDKNKSYSRRIPTEDEILDLKIVSHNISGLIKMAHEYMLTNQDPEGIEKACLAVFGVLEILFEPIENYLTEYAGKAAAP